MLGEGFCQSAKLEIDFGAVVNWAHYSRLAKSKLNSPAVIIVLIAAVLALAGLTTWLVDVSKRRRPSQPLSTTIPSHEKVEPTDAQVVERFRDKVMNIPESKQLFAGMEPGVTRGVLKIQVTDFWFQAKPYQKRQVIQLLADTWRAESKRDTVILHLYDRTGREVAGTKAFGGIWLEDE